MLTLEQVPQLQYAIVLTKPYITCLPEVKIQKDILKLYLPKHKFRSDIDALLYICVPTLRTSIAAYYSKNSKTLQEIMYSKGLKIITNKINLLLDILYIGHNSGMCCWKSALNIYNEQVKIC